MGFLWDQGSHLGHFSIAGHAELVGEYPVLAFVIGRDENAVDGFVEDDHIRVAVVDFHLELVVDL